MIKPQTFFRNQQLKLLQHRFTFISHNTKNNYNWFYDKNTYSVHYKGKAGVEPYNAIIGGFRGSDNKNYIFVYGVASDGNIAGVKRLIDNQATFLEPITLSVEKSMYIGDRDIDGFSIAARMQSQDGIQHYDDNSEVYDQRTKGLLAGQPSHVEYLTVLAEDGAILRLKRLSEDYPVTYKSKIVDGTTPVVMAAGIFSNIDTFRNGLGGELAAAGYDVWLLELTGGPFTDGDCLSEGGRNNCPDYTYDDIVTKYWPALVGAVSKYTGQNKVQYIGHSNGCRAALSSLNAYPSGKVNAGTVFNPWIGTYQGQADMPSAAVDKFFGVACPATLNEETLYTKNLRSPVYIMGLGIIADSYAEYSLQQLQGKEHVGLGDYAKYFIEIGGLLDNDAKISYSLLKFYSDLGFATDSTFTASNANMNELYLFNGYPTDGILGAEDQNRIFNSVSAGVKEGFNYTRGFTNHVAIKSHEDVRRDIEVKLNG